MGENFICPLRPVFPQKYIKAAKGTVRGADYYHSKEVVKSFMGGTASDAGNGTAWLRHVS
jgi:hypothetical protein